MAYDTSKLASLQALKDTATRIKKGSGTCNILNCAVYRTTSYQTKCQYSCYNNSNKFFHFLSPSHNPYCACSHLHAKLV